MWVKLALGIITGHLKTHKWLKWVLVAGVALFTGYKAYQKYNAERDARIIAEFKLQGQIQLTEWTAGRLAQAEVDRQEMRELVEASNKINGKLLATVGILIKQRDTTLAHPELPTEASEGTRTASFADSAFGVRVKGTVNAPPYPAPLGIQYQFTRKPFNPTVGFTQVGDSVVALVNWEGEEFEIRSPSYQPMKPKIDRFGAFVEGNYAPFHDEAEGRVGGRLTAGKWHMQGSVTQDFPLHDFQTRFNLAPRLYVGVRRDF